MKTLLIILSLLFASANNSSTLEFRVEIYPEKSELMIAGESNVNCFDFKYKKDLLQKDFSVKIDKNNGKLSFHQTTLNLHVQGFKSGNYLMDKDFYNMLKANEYPEISIELNSVKNKGSLFLIDIEIKMAGKSKMQTVIVNDLSTAEIHHLKGSAKLRFSDFDLEPPSKFMGMVKVKDELAIAFDLAFNLTEI
jgi:hypothetical protein